MDKHVGVQVKLLDPLTIHAIPEHLCSGVPLLRSVIEVCDYIISKITNVSSHLNDAQPI